MIQMLKEDVQLLAQFEPAQQTGKREHEVFDFPFGNVWHATTSGLLPEMPKKLLRLDVWVKNA